MSPKPEVHKRTFLLRDEHRELLPYADRLCTVADGIGRVSLASLRDEVDQVGTLLSEALLPRARAEDTVIYPLLAAQLGELEATSIMGRDHAQIRHLVQELSEVRSRLWGPRLKSTDANALRRILYGLAALLRLHLEQEEVYLSLLDARLDEKRAQEVFRELEAEIRRAAR
jgi:hypothetical protein